LQFDRAGDVFRSAQHFDVGVTADDPNRATRRIEQDSVERPAVPPIVGSGRVTPYHLRGEAEAREVVPDHREPAVVAIHRPNLVETGTGLEYVACLAARGCARVEHPLPGRKVEESGGALRGNILHRHVARGEPGQLVDGSWRLERNRSRDLGRRARRDTRCLQPFDVRVASAVAQIHAQPHRRSGVVRVADAAPVVRPITLELGQEPPRMAEVRLAVGRKLRVELGPLALKAPQHRVHEWRGVALPNRRGCVDRCGHRRVLRDP